MICIFQIGQYNVEVGRQPAGRFHSNSRGVVERKSVDNFCLMC